MVSTVHALVWQKDRRLTGPTYLELGSSECGRARLYRSSANGSFRYAAQRSQENLGGSADLPSSAEVS
ncbi:hypothetical protein ACSBR2_000743 [Camellia fascicularis]